jgi:hypothetical protein
MEEAMEEAMGEGVSMRVVLKDLLEGEPAVFTPIQAEGRVRSSSKSIRASATPGPFSKADSIPRIPRL